MRWRRRQPVKQHGRRVVDEEFGHRSRLDLLPRLGVMACHQLWDWMRGEAKLRARQQAHLTLKSLVPCFRGDSFWCSDGWLGGGSVARLDLPHTHGTFLSGVSSGCGIWQVESR